MPPVRALSILVRGLLAIAFLLLVFWLGLVAWAEVERGRWRDVAGEATPPEEPRGGIELEAARAMYSDYTGGETIAPESPEGIAAYVRDTEEFVALVGAALERGHVRPGPDDESVAELAACVEQALGLRMRHYAREPGGLAEAAAALDLLFRFVGALPSDSVRCAEIRAGQFGRAVHHLRALAQHPEFATAGVRPLFDAHLRMIESNADLHGAIAGERARRVREAEATLEPGAPEASWLRPTWRALLKRGDLVPLLYRERREALRTLDRLDELVDMPRAAREKHLSGLPPDPVAARMGVLFAQRPALQAAARITRLGLAAIAHRRERGAWPVDPSALADRFDDGLPVDPYTGQLFAFQRTDEELHFAPSKAGGGAAWTLRAAP